MIAEPKKTWTEADVQALIGQSESIRREFKAGVMFDHEVKSKWIEALAKEVSAFANTEGGELVLGIEEDKDKKSKLRVAVRVDGVPTTIGPEHLQQLIEGNLSPYLPGIRIHRVKLSAHPDRVVYVIRVPQGSTAYQAGDRHYYGRSEFEAKPLPDHVIRLLMSRGKIARAAVDLRLRRVALGTKREAELRAKHAAALEALKTDATDALARYPELLDLMAARFHPDEICFDLVLRNDGELTVRDPAVQIRAVRSEQLSDGWTVQGDPPPSRLEMRGELIYPGDERDIAGSSCQLRCKREATLTEGDYVLHWKVFLDDSPPCTGEIDLGTNIRSARR